MKGRELLTLDNRLMTCASMVRKGTKLVDVGTDHAYLPIRLAAEGWIDTAVACDIRVGPLENAKSNIVRFGVEDKVSAVLSDGLDAIVPECAFDIVIAGMGGELIAEIIRRTAWVYDGSRRLILQPMTRAYVLRKFLCENGFCIVEEKACCSGKKCYSVMQCVYDGVKRVCDDRMAYIGTLSAKTSPEAEQYIKMTAFKLRRKVSGLLQSGQVEEAERCQNILRAVAQELPDTEQE